MTWYWPLFALRAMVAVFAFFAVIELSVRGYEAARRTFRRRRDARFDRQMALLADQLRPPSRLPLDRADADRARLHALSTPHTGVELGSRPNPFARSASKGFKR